MICCLAISNSQTPPGWERSRGIRGRGTSLALAAVFISLAYRAPFGNICPRAGFFVGLMSHSSEHWPLSSIINSFTQAIHPLDDFLQPPRSSCLWQYTHSFSPFGAFHSSKQLSWASRHQDDSSWLPSELATWPKGASLISDTPTADSPCTAF